MQLPLDIVYRHTLRTPASEFLVRELAQKLHRYAPDLIACRVTVEEPGHRRHSGNLVRVRIDVTLSPHRELLVTESTLAKDGHNREIMPLIRRAFATMSQRLDDAAEMRGLQRPRRSPLPGPNGQNPAIR